MTMTDPPDPVPAGQVVPPDPRAYGRPPRPNIDWRCPYGDGVTISYDPADEADAEAAFRKIDAHTARHLQGAAGG